MFTLGRLFRRLTKKFRRQIGNRVKYIVIFFICVILFKKLILERRYFGRKSAVIRQELLDYNEDDLRKDWPFKINKHYDMNELREYVQKPRILAKAAFPGERGDDKSFLLNLFKIFSKTYFNQIAVFVFL